MITSTKAAAPSKASERAQAQRERILDAAQKCFVERGFHAASMGSISEAAQMSPGLIYRYFKSKSEIILAIIERQLAEKRADIATLQSDTELIPRIEELFCGWQQADAAVTSAPLFLEMTAEASRDPQIAEAVRTADLISRADFSAWLKCRKTSDGSTLSDEEAQWRTFCLQCFVDGLAIRAIREPDLDQAMLRRSLQALLPMLIPEADEE